MILILTNNADCITSYVLMPQLHLLTCFAHATMSILRRLMLPSSSAPYSRHLCHSQDENFRKIFVGGLHYNTSEESLRAFYQQWGEVTQAIVMRDQTSQRYCPLHFTLWYCMVSRQGGTQLGQQANIFSSCPFAC